MTSAVQLLRTIAEGAFHDHLLPAFSAVAHSAHNCSARILAAAPTAVALIQDSVRALLHDTAAAATQSAVGQRLRQDVDTAIATARTPTEAATHYLGDLADDPVPPVAPQTPDTALQNSREVACAPSRSEGPEMTK